MDNTKKYFGNFKKDARGQGIDVFRIVMAVVIVGAILGVLFLAMPHDREGDGVLDAMDNCPMVCNPSQMDIDGDGCGDACDANVNRHNTSCRMDPMFRDLTGNTNYTEACRSQ